MRTMKVFVSWLVVALTPLPTQAAELPYFYGKTITFQVGAPAGGRQDRIARTMARYLTKYTPGNPAFLIQNKTGGQGIAAMLALSKGPTDGSFMSTVISSYMEAPYFGAPGATYDPRAFVYVGAPGTGKQRNALFFHQRAGIRTVEDLKKRELTLGAQGGRQPKLSLFAVDCRSFGAESSLGARLRHAAASRRHRTGGN